MNKDNITTISIAFILVILLGIIFVLVLSNFSNQVYEFCCDQENGTLIFYECQNIPGATPCSELKTGYYCNLNGKEIKIEDLECFVNVTNNEVAS